MPRKSVLTPSQKVSLLSFPTSKIEFERYYTLSENDLFIIHQKRVQTYKWVFFPMRFKNSLN